jgi:predicted Zn finger-like uncharacterized protein
MRFSCSSCNAQYMISDEKVGPGGVKVRCKKCGTIIPVKRAPAVAPTIEAAAPSPFVTEQTPRAAPGEGTLETELGTAFQNVFGGGSAGLASEHGAAVAEAPAPGDGASTLAEAATTAAAGGPAPSAEAFDDWYVAVDDDQVGPIPASSVKSRWESGEVGPDTLAWRPGMADWSAISSIPEMAQYLAPVARGGKAAPFGAAAAPAPAGLAAHAAQSEPKEAPRAAAPTPTPSTVAGLNGAARDGEWHPAAASALAALASEEMASLARPEPNRAASTPAQGAPAAGGSLLERMELPDGGVDPTNVVPLPLKGLDPTGEAALKTKKPAAAAESTQIRELKKTTTRSMLYIALAMVALFAVGIGVVVAMMRPSREAPRATAQPESAPATAASAPSAPAPAPAPAPSPAVAAAPTPSSPPASASGTSTSTPPAASNAVPGTPEAAPPPAAASAPAPREPERVAEAQQKEPPARAEPPRRRRQDAPQRVVEKPAKRSRRLAQANEPVPAAPPVQAPAQQAPPPPAPAPRATESDDEIDKILSGSGGSAPAQASPQNGNGAARKRSVYVPPAIGSDLPENVSVSQINEAVLGQKPALLRCIEQQKAADSGTSGTLKMRWVIAGDGGVKDVRVLSDEFSKQPIAGCISGVVKGLHFPRSRTSGQEVVFPFKF